MGIWVLLSVDPLEPKYRTLWADLKLAFLYVSALSVGQPRCAYSKKGLLPVLLVYFMSMLLSVLCMTLIAVD